jgi:transglutaminase-like putative cysteine protease
MKKPTIFLITALTLLLVPVAFAKTVSGLISMDFDLSHQPPGKVVQLWIPYPVSNADQDISGINISGDFTESAVYTDKVFRTPMLYVRWDKDTKSRKLSFTFRAEREEVIHRDFPSHEAAWDPADFSKYLASTRLGPIEGEVKSLADEITMGKQGVLAKAKAIYDWTVENTYRNPNTRGCGLGDVYRLLQEPGGKCTDISSIFVALARAAGVPARETFGIRMGKKTTQDITTWQHCWAEFYLPGYGWVPVDPADVRKMMLVEKLELDDKKTKEYREYFWGGIDSYRIRLGEGRDLLLNPRQHGEPLNYLMYPFAQVGETTLDWLDPKTFKYSIIYNKVEEVAKN